MLCKKYAHALFRWVGRIIPFLELISFYQRIFANIERLGYYYTYFTINDKTKDRILQEEEESNVHQIKSSYFRGNQYNSKQKQQIHSTLECNKSTYHIFKCFRYPRLAKSRSFYKLPTYETVASQLRNSFSDK